MRTRRSISTAWARASAGATLRWRRIASVIWSPTVNAGLSDVIGSWKIIASLSPRRSRRRRGAHFSRSSPSNSTSPAAMRPGGCGTRPMIESALTLFPQPDSPTIPSVRPRSSRKSTPSTARTSPCSPLNSVRSPRTSRSAGAGFFMFGDCLFDLLAVERAPRPRLGRGAAHERDEALMRFLVQPAQLGDRLGMIVYANRKRRVLFGRVDEQRRGLLAALVPARRVARVQRKDQSIGEFELGIFFICARRKVDHALSREHVPRNRVALAGDRAAPVDARGAGVLADPAGRIDHMDLAM